MTYSNSKAAKIYQHNYIRAYSKDEVPECENAMICKVNSLIAGTEIKHNEEILKSNWDRRDIFYVLAGLISKIEHVGGLNYMNINDYFYFVPRNTQLKQETSPKLYDASEPIKDWKDMFYKIVKLQIEASYKLYDALAYTCPSDPLSNYNHRNFYLDITPNLYDSFAIEKVNNFYALCFKSFKDTIIKSAENNDVISSFFIEKNQVLEGLSVRYQKANDGSKILVNAWLHNGDKLTNAMHLFRSEDAKKVKKDASTTMQSQRVREEAKPRKAFIKYKWPHRSRLGAEYGDYDDWNENMDADLIHTQAPKSRSVNIEATNSLSNKLDDILLGKGNENEQEN